MKLYSKIAAGVAAFLLISGLVASAAAESSPPAVGGRLPEIVLTAPHDTELRQYLGIDGKKTFTIPEIKTEVVIIEVFSMY